jgi:putative ABC transport system permease protein
MYKLSFLIAKNLGRNKVRTGLTACAVIVLVMIYTMVSTVTSTISSAVEAHSSETRLLVRSKWAAIDGFPRRFMPQIIGMSGVADWTSWNFYGGLLDKSGQEDRKVFGIATRVENIREMHPGLEAIEPSVLEAMRRNRIGALVGPKLMRKMKWKVGQRFTFIGTSRLGKDLEFEVVGELPESDYSEAFMFRDDYYQEGVGDRERVGLLWIRVTDASAANHLASQIEDQFAHSDTPLQVETESATATRMLSKHRSLVMLIRLVALILLVDMAIVLSNSINIATQERRIEMAVLKVLGFQPLHIAYLVVGEAVLVGALSGLLGTSLTYAYSELNQWEGWPYKAQFLTTLPVKLDAVPWGILYGGLIGLAGSLIPASTARKVRVSDVFSHVA